MTNENQVNERLTTDRLSVWVNGERRQLPAGTSLLDVVHALDLEPQRVAIELNREIVKRDSWSTTTITDGAEVEIVQFVGGG